MLTRSLDHPYNPIALPGTDAITIRRLGFVDTLAHVGTFVDGTMGRDVDFRLLERSRVAYAVARWVILPLYFQWRCAGYGAFQGERLVGLTYLRARRQALHVDAIAVHPDFRRQGIGRALLRLAERQARTAGRRWLSLRVTLSNEPAVRLYESEGFRRARHEKWWLDDPVQLEPNHADPGDGTIAKATLLKPLSSLPDTHEQEGPHGD